MSVVRVKYLDNDEETIQHVTMKSHNDHEYVYITQGKVIRIPRRNVKIIHEINNV